jgi:hypothetical protein
METTALFILMYFQVLILILLVHILDKIKDSTIKNIQILEKQ